MSNAHRLATIGAVMVCFVGAQAATVFASEDTRRLSETVSSASAAVPSETDLSAPRLNLDLGFLAASPSLAQSSQWRSDFAPTEASALTGQVYRGRPYRTGRNNGSIAAMMIGAAAAITGAAILVYANRPECSGNQFAGGCGYGTKVVGTSVLVGGGVGLFVGALTWR